MNIKESLEFYIYTIFDRTKSTTERTKIVYSQVDIDILKVIDRIVYDYYICKDKEVKKKDIRNFYYHRYMEFLRRDERLKEVLNEK